MKVKAEYKRERIEVGLSAAVPSEDEASTPRRASETAEFECNVSFVRHTETYRVEYDVTTEEAAFGGAPSQERLNCLNLVSRLPEEALPELEETLEETRAHYLGIERERERAKQLTAAPSREIAAGVASYLRT